MNSIKQIVIYLFLFMATFLMVKMVWLYSSFNPSVAFLALKQDYINNGIWRYCFYIHVFSSVITLLAGFTQFNQLVLAHFTNWHRVMGKIYILFVLFMNVPSGFVLAIYANGYWSSKIAFIILDLLWFFYTLKAWLAIGNKNFLEHKNYMIRSFALTLSAITLRTWKLFFSTFTTLDHELVYMIDAWLGFIPNLLIAEFFIIKSIKIKLFK